MKAQLKTDLEKLKKALDRLNEVYNWPESHDGRTEAAIQCFEFVMDLYWKLFKHMLRQKELVVNTPRDVFREVFAAAWIDDEQVWLRMLKDRNLTSHTYNEDLASEILTRIGTYLPVLNETFTITQSRIKDMD